MEGGSEFQRDGEAVSSSVATEERLNVFGRVLKYIDALKKEQTVNDTQIHSGCPSLAR